MRAKEWVKGGAGGGEDGGQGGEGKGKAAAYFTPRDGFLEQKYGFLNGCMAALPLYLPK